MAGIAAFGNVGKAGLVGSVGGPAFEHEAAIAIAAIDIAMLVDLEPDTRMAERGGAIIGAAANGAGAVAADAARGDLDDFGRCDAHAAADNPNVCSMQSPLCMRRANGLSPGP